MRSRRDGASRQVIKCLPLFELVAHSLCQFSEEGYAVVQVSRPRDTGAEQDCNEDARETLRVVRQLGSSWAIITYGVTREDTVFISNLLDATHRAPNLKACIHFTISCESTAAFIPRTSVGQVLP